MVKEDEKASKKRKSTPEPKAAVSMKRKAETPEPKTTEATEETPSMPPATEIAEILKVMTESLPIKLLSPLGPKLTKLLQNKDEPSATKEKADDHKKRRIVNVMQAIERTPPLASASKIAPIASAEAIAEATAAAEATNLESTLSGIDKILSDMAAEETAAATEKVMAIVPDKGKKITDAASKESDFDLQNLVGQELSEAEKKKLQEYGISFGYQPGAMLFGGIDKGALGCIRDRAGAKIIDTLSKSVGFPKLEADISGYRRQHNVGSLFYSNFKVKFLLLGFFYFCDEAKFSNVGLFLQSMLLSKALRMQQDLEDKKNEIIIEGLESKIKDYEASLEKKGFLLQAIEGSREEIQAKNARQSEELLQSQTTLKEKSESFKQEKKELQTKYEADKNTKLQKSLKDLRDTCLNFGSHCVQQLKGVFSSVGASSEDITPLAEDITNTFKHIENEVDALDEVIAGHGDFCAFVASRGTAAAFFKASCTHAKTVNIPTLILSPLDLIDIPSEARSIGNRFITQIWAKGGRELAGDEARNLLKPVRNLYLLLALILIITFTSFHCLSVG
jgi:hypothetical protein